MPRLPIPGSDKGTWGDVLNDFLNVAHNADGTLKPIDKSSIAGLAPVATTGNYTDLAGKPSLSAVATSGDYGDLINKPTIPAVPVQSVAGKTGAVTLGESDIAGLAGDLATLQSGVAAASVALSTTGVKTANYTAGPNQIIPVDSSSGIVTITLPSAPADKTQIIIKKIDGSANSVNVALSGSDVLNTAGGPTSFSIQLSSQAYTVAYAAGPKIWYAVSGSLPLGVLDSRYATPASVTTATAGTVNNASLSGRALTFTTVGGSTINVGNIVPNLTMGTLTSAAYGVSAAATIGGTSVDPTLSLTIPQGAPGDVTPASSSTGTTLAVSVIPSTYTLTMSGNVTSITLPSPSASIAATATLILIQDATGSRTVTWPVSVKWNEGVAPQPSTAAGAVSVFSLLWTGSLWIGFKSGQNFA